MKRSKLLLVSLITVLTAAGCGALKDTPRGEKFQSVTLNNSAVLPTEQCTRGMMTVETWKDLKGGNPTVTRRGRAMAFSEPTKNDLGLMLFRLKPAQSPKRVKVDDTTFDKSIDLGGKLDVALVSEVGIPSTLGKGTASSTVLKALTFDRDEDFNNLYKTVDQENEFDVPVAPKAAKKEEEEKPESDKDGKTEDVKSDDGKAAVIQNKIGMSIVNSNDDVRTIVGCSLDLSKNKSFSLPVINSGLPADPEPASTPYGYKISAQVGADKTMALPISVEGNSNIAGSEFVVVSITPKVKDDEKPAWRALYTVKNPTAGSIQVPLAGTDQNKKAFDVPTDKPLSIRIARINLQGSKIVDAEEAPKKEEEPAKDKAAGKKEEPKVDKSGTFCMATMSVVETNLALQAPKKEEKK